MVVNKCYSQQQPSHHVQQQEHKLQVQAGYKLTVICDKCISPNYLYFSLFYHDEIQKRFRGRQVRASSLLHNPADPSHPLPSHPFARGRLLAAAAQQQLVKK